jgi:HD-GYP domain-containing protein (c-di-GMP phosphodiesterase class II)
MAAPLLQLDQVLGALSLATDLGAGVPMETSLKTCLVAARVGQAIGLAGAPLVDVRQTALLRHLGCTSYSHEAARLAAGDDHDVLATFEGTDRGRRTAIVGRAVSRLARGAPAHRRVAAVARVLGHPGAGAALAVAQCQQAVALAGDLALGTGVLGALGQIHERYDGRGDPDHLSGDGLHLPARLLHVALVIEILHRQHGRERALGELARRRGAELDPALVDAAVEIQSSLWHLLELPSVWEQYMADCQALPSRVEVPLARVCEAFGRFADLKSPFSLGHSTGVAELAARAADSADGAERLRLAGLLHDLGGASVPNGIWDKPGPLSAAEWERVRLHGYYTERILARSPELAAVATLAGSHHERLDGNGYHSGHGAATLGHEARILAAADVYRALLEARPHREARTPAEAARVMREEITAGRLCARAVDQVLAAAGHHTARPSYPAGLTRREVEVLVQLARGLSNKEIAVALGMATRTASHHIEHIYEKTGVSTRAAAALFAVRHDLLAGDAD